MAFDWTTIFTEVGKLIMLRNKITAAATEIDAHKTDLDGALDDSAAELDFLAAALSTIQDAQANLDTAAANVAELVGKYVDEILPALIDSTGQSRDEILQDLYDAMVAESQTVQQNTVSAGSPTGSAAGNGTIAGLAATQMAIPDDITIRCINATTQGAELWEIESRARQKRSSGITTGEVFPAAGEDDEFGLTGTITVSAADETAITNDGATQLANPAITGAVASSNTDANKKLYAKLLGCGVSALTKPGDTMVQIVDLDLAGVVKGTNTDADGKLYASLVGTNGTSIVEANDGGNRVSAWTITGAVKATNTDAAGKLYVKCIGTGGSAEVEIANDGASQLTSSQSYLFQMVTAAGVEMTALPQPGGVADASGYVYCVITKDGSNYDIKLYNDSGCAAGALVGHTNTFTAAGLIPVLEDNASGIAGHISVAAPSASDADISIHYRLGVVEVYKDVGCGSSDLVAQSFYRYDPGTWTLYAENASGLSGHVAAAAAILTGSDTDISLALPFQTINLYKDAAGSNLVAHYTGASATAAATDVALVADNASGLSGTISYAYQADQALIPITLPLYRLELYSDSGRTALVAHVGWTMDADAAGTSLVLVEDNTSGLSGTIDIDYSVDDVDIVIQCAQQFEVDQEFRVALTVTDAGTIQSFWRDVFERVLPCSTGSGVTIDDSLAED